MTSIPTINTTVGLDRVLQEVAGQVPIFIPALLLFIYALVFIIGYKKQKEQSNAADIPQWATVAGIVTSIVALILSIGTSIINISTLITTFAITIVSAIWFLSSGDRQW